MKFEYDSQAQALQIASYKRGQIKLGDRILERAFVVCADEIRLDILPANIDAVANTHLSALVEFGKSIIVLGTGATQRFLDPSVLAPVYDAQIGIEVLNTAAACRIYNVLVGENRDVVGAFFMP